MASDKTNNILAFALAVIFIIGALFYGLIVIGQPLFTGIIITLGLPLYFIWRYLR